MALLFLLLCAVAASPAVQPQRQYLAPTIPVTNATSRTTLHHYVGRVIQSNSGSGSSSDNAVLSVPAIIVASICALFTLAAILLLSHQIYYRHANLKLRRQFLDRLAILTPPPEEQRPDDGTARPPAPRRARTVVAAEAYGIAVMMASSAQLSPAIYSALQQQEPESSVRPVESKTRVMGMEDKVLGRREDVTSLGRRVGQAAIEGRLSSVPRLAP